MNTDFAELTALHQEWQSLQPLKPEHEARLWKKLRLDWNYHSNHIEGNTLTYSETELLLIHGGTHGDHTHREHLEMKAHDLGIEYVRTLASDTSRVLTEGDIRDLNQIILKEPFWAPAITPDGQPTQKWIVPGQYKTTPNQVLLATGGIFSYASVEDTPPRMAALAAWLREQIEDSTLPPVAIATKLHHDFVAVHPFDDGNGRVARLLMNYVLLRFGYLPLVVPTKEKSATSTLSASRMLTTLHALTDYLAGLTAKSLNLGIKAAKGEPIDEPSDVEKELEIFIRQQQGQQDRVVRRSKKSIQDIFRHSIQPLVSAVDAKLKKLGPLFVTHKVIFQPAMGMDERGSLTKALDAILQGIMPQEQFTHVMPLNVQHQFGGYRGQGAGPFGFAVSLHVEFEEFQYFVRTDSREMPKKLYSEPILTDEAETIATKMLADAFEHVKRQTKTARP